MIITKYRRAVFVDNFRDTQSCVWAVLENVVIGKCKAFFSFIQIYIAWIWQPSTLPEIHIRSRDSGDRNGCILAVLRHRCVRIRIAIDETTPWAETTAFLVVALILTELLVHSKHGCPNRRLAWLCYVACGHICKFYVFCKDFIVVWKVMCTNYCDTFSLRTASQRITDVALCSNSLGTPVLRRGGAVVEALLYKPEGRGIDSRWCHWNFTLT
jgi:hypothetical protein